MKFITGLLDNIKSKGRYGDTELRIVDNEVSHVNKDEAYLIDNYGLLGQVITQGTGSGTINPSTGLREYHSKKVLGVEGHPYHHSSWWNLPTDTIEKVEKVAEDIYTTPNTITGDALIDEEDIVEEPPPPPPGVLDDSYDLDTVMVDGEEIQKPTRAGVMQFIDPETNTLTDPQGLAQYIRDLNPNMTMFEGLDDFELIEKFRQYAPDMFASQEDIQDTRKQFTSDARTRTKKAGQEMMQMDFAMGASGITRHGDPNRKITEGLYEDMSKMHKQKSKDMEDLKQGDIDTFGDYVYGLTDEDSEYGIKGGTY